jgi:hypothetical protein
MGAILEMTILRPSAVLLTAALTLAACGTDPSAGELAGPVAIIVSALKLNKAARAPTLATLDAAGIATLRQALEADGQAIYLVGNATLKYTNLMAPFGQNGDVQTWASTSYETIALRNGMLVASRGFGADLMSSTGPSISQVAAGKGMTARSYHYLDGADQPHRFDFTCTLSTAGGETVVVLGKPYVTRKVAEVCNGQGDTFTNEYWFDQRTNLRQSRQRITPGMENLLLQRVID